MTPPRAVMALQIVDRGVERTPEDRSSLAGDAGKVVGCHRSLVKDLPKGLARGSVMTEHSDHEELASGTWGRVLGVKDARGVSESFDWLVSLGDKQQGGMRARLDRLAETGFLKAPENFRQLSDDGAPVVYEVKHVGLNLRLYVIKGNRVFYATHGGLKPSKSRVAAEVKRARRIFKEYRSGK